MPQVAGIIREIFRKAGIDYTRLKDPESVIERATEIFDEALLKHAAGNPKLPISDAEKNKILNEAAAQIIQELHDQFHGR